MIPIITQQGPNITEQYWCGNCNAHLPDPQSFKDRKDGRRWIVCPFCAEPIEYEKAEPVQWSEMDCERCGHKLIREMQSTPKNYFVTTSRYVGATLCRECLEEHCLETSCLQCEVGKWLGCPYLWVKQSAMARVQSDSENGGQYEADR